MPHLIVKHKAVFFPLMTDLIASSDKKKLVFASKMLGEWVQAYRQASQMDDDEEESKEELKIFENSPFNDEESTAFVSETLKSMGVSETIEVLVEYYNILCNLDEKQWPKLFTEAEISAIVDKALATGD